MKKVSRSRNRSKRSKSPRRSRSKSSPRPSLAPKPLANYSLKKAWGQYADEMSKQLRPVQQIGIPPGLNKKPWLEYHGVRPQDDYDEHIGAKDYAQLEREWDMYSKQNGGYGPGGYDSVVRGGGRGEGVMTTADLLGGRRKKSKRGKSKRGKSKRGKSKRGKSRSKSKSKSKK